MTWHIYRRMRIAKAAAILVESRTVERGDHGFIAIADGESG